MIKQVNKFFTLIENNMKTLNTKHELTHTQPKNLILKHGEVFGDFVYSKWVGRRLQILP
jgi:hypothetical protein